MSFTQTKHLCVLIQIWTKGEVGAPLNRFKILLTVPRWYFFVDLLCFFLSCVCYAFVHVCLYVPCGHLLGKGWPLSSRLWCLTVSLFLSHWYPGSGVVLDCIDSLSLHPYLLLLPLSEVHSQLYTGIFYCITLWFLFSYCIALWVHISSFIVLYWHIVHCIDL